MTTTNQVIDLRDQLGAVGDQGRRGTCVAFALTALHAHARAGSTEPLSEEFLYWSAKKRDALSGDGTTFAAAATSLAGDGQAVASLWPYDEMTSHGDTGYGPSQAAIADGATKLAQCSSTSLAVSDLRETLNAGRAIAIAIPVWDEFELADGASVVPIPANISTMALEYAVVIAGHDPITEAVLVRNSWGTRWGDRGYAWFAEALPIEVRQSRGWTLTTIRSSSP